MSGMQCEILQWVRCFIIQQIGLCSKLSYSGITRVSLSWVGPCAGEDEEDDAARRANGLRSPPSRTLSESGGSQDFEDDAREAMQEMLGAQEWHQVSLLLQDHPSNAFQPG